MKSLALFLVRFRPAPFGLAAGLLLAAAVLIGGCDSATQVEADAMIRAEQASETAPVTGTADRVALEESTGDQANSEEQAAVVGGDIDVSLQAVVSKPSYNRLAREAAYVIENKGTEPRSDGGYTLTKTKGTYICRRCNAMLYSSADKFDSHCGWPSFDSQFDGAVAWEMDADGKRVEILCNHCDGHLGHVFQGEHLTERNTRHCVNSISMVLVPAGTSIPAKIVIEK